MKSLKNLVSPKKLGQCANCQCAFTSETEKTPLVKREDVLNVINTERESKQQAKLNDTDVICLRCMNKALIHLCETVRPVVNLRRYSSASTEQAEPVYQNLDEARERMQVDDDVPSCSICNASINDESTSYTVEEESEVLKRLQSEARVTSGRSVIVGSVICQSCHLSILVPEIPDESDDEAMELSRAELEVLEGGKRKSDTFSTCANCDKRLYRTKGRPRQLKHSDPVLLNINMLRSSQGKPSIAVDCTVCNSCYVKGTKMVSTAPTQLSSTEPEVVQPNDSEMNDLSQQFSSESFRVSQSASWSGASDSWRDSESVAVSSPLVDTSPVVELEMRCLKEALDWCCVCQKLGWRVGIDKIARVKLWLTNRIFIPFSNRVCSEHIDKETKCFTPGAIENIISQTIESTTRLHTTEMMRWIEDLSSTTEAISSRGRLTFRCLDYFALDDFKCLFGISKEAFIDMHGVIEPHMYNTKARSTFDALAMFLLKLCQNMSHRTISCIFGMNRQAVGFNINKVRVLLAKLFVPKHLGYDHISREKYITEWHTYISKVLSGVSEGQAITVIDGTYINIQKSCNYKIQSKTWSMHKHTNLVKAMMVVAPNGNILAVEGPYFANSANSDANILKSMTKDKNGFRSFFKEGDVIFEDRGFRDSNQLMAKLGYTTKMPHFIGNRKQHPTNESNESRLVTKIRFVVESQNGRIKNKFKFFRDVVPNKYIDNSDALWDFFLVACSILNAFCPPLKQDTAEDIEFAQKMVERSGMPNLLQDRIVDENYVRKTNAWKELQSGDKLLDFPKLTMKDLRCLTFGVYQIKQAPSYIAHSVEDDSDISIWVHDELGPAGARFQIRSRHSNSVKYNVWIGYTPNSASWKGITGWYCQCRSGARVVGTCAHIAAIVWYLSYSRHHVRTVIPGKNVAATVRDASNFSYEEEFDSDSELSGEEPQDYFADSE